MLSNKSIKKFILLSLFITLSAQAITMPSWLSFLSKQSNLSQFYPAIGKVFKKHTKVGAIVLVGCITTFLGVRYFKKQKARRKEQKRLKQVDQQKKIAQEILAKEAEQEAAEKAEQEAAEKREQEAVEANRIKREKEAEVNRVKREEAVEANRIKQERETEAKRIKREETVEANRIKQEKETEAKRIKREEAVEANRIKQERETEAKRIKQEVAEKYDFCAVDRVDCSKLTYNYVNKLFDPDTPLRDFISEANDHSSEDRKILAQIVPHDIGTVSEKKFRVFEYIKNGYENLTNILNDNFKDVPGYNQVVHMSDEDVMVFQSEEKAGEKEKIRKSYLSSIISVVWCLYDCALRTGDAFEQGAFNEKSKKLYDFFLHYIIFVNPDYEQLGWLGGNCNHPYAYQRVSTHLKDLAKKRTIFQYGIDVRRDEGGEACDFLPNRMTHILFIPYDSDKFILKPEDGCMYNYGEIFCHGVGFVRSKLETLVGSSDSEKYQRKERIPKTIISDFDKLMKQAPVNDQKRTQYNEEVKALGIQRIVSLAAGELKEYDPLRQYSKQLKKDYKYTNTRFGNEVILPEKKLRELVSCG